MPFFPPWLPLTPAAFQLLAMTVSGLKGRGLRDNSLVS